MTAEHRPLSERGLLSADIADALEILVGADSEQGLALPRAYTRSDVVDTLIKIVHRNEDGTFDHVRPNIRHSLLETYGNRLANSSVFQAGYKRFETRSQYPVVPVTDFFFKNEFGDQLVAAVLDAMSDFEIRHSLPERPRRMRQSEDGDYLRDEDGDFFQSGLIAGVVVFPQRSRYNLLRAWLNRRARYADGQVRSAVASLEHARPDSPDVQELKTHTRTFGPAMRKALPRVKPTE
jgi:hypothetical protein